MHNPITTFKNQCHIEYDNGSFYNQDSHYFVKDIYGDYQILFNNICDIDYHVLDLVREICVRKMENNGSLFMHGSTVELNNQGVLIIGVSGSGKSTMMLKLLESDLGNAFITNDRTFLTPNNQLSYFPIPLHIGIGTINSSEKLLKYLRDMGKIERSNFREKYLPADPEKKIIIYPQNLSDAYDIPFKSNTNLGRIVIPSLQHDSHGTVELEEIHNPELLMENCFTPYDFETLRNHWVIKRALSDVESKIYSAQRIKEILEKTPVIKLNFSYNASYNEIADKVLTFKKKG